MTNLKDYVNFKLTHADKTAEAEGYPLVLENCKANKRMKQLEIYGNSFQDGTPTPDNPIEVESVGVKSVNLFDIDNTNYDDGHLIVPNGGANINANYITTNFLEILKPNKSYTVSFNQIYETAKTTNRCVAYDSNQNVIGTLWDLSCTFGKQSSNFTTPDNLAYIRIGMRKTDEDFQIQEGSTVTPYEPYGKYKIPVVSRGVNLFSMSMVNATAKTVNGITFTPLDDERVHIKGKLADTSTYADYRMTRKSLSYFDIATYRAKPNPYTYSGLTMIFNMSNGTSSTNINASQLNNAIGFENAYLNFAQLRVVAGTTIEFDDIIELQLMKGTENLPYEPYIQPITSNIFLNEPLRKIGDYADYVDFKENKVVRNTFVRVYDGKSDKDNPFNKSDNEENWAGSENHGDVLENFWAYTLNDTLPIIPKNGHHSANDYKQMPICLQLPVKTGYYDSTTSDATVDKEMIWFSQQGRGVRLYLLKDRVGGTRNNILTYLRSNPITVVFATYQPYEEPITCELPKLTSKITIIEVDTSLMPSNMYGKYIKR